MSDDEELDSNNIPFSRRLEVSSKRIDNVKKPAPSRRRRSRGEVLDTLATLFGTYVGVGGRNGSSKYDGDDTASTVTSLSADCSPRRLNNKNSSSKGRGGDDLSYGNDDDDNRNNRDNDTQTNDDDDTTESNYSPQHGRSHREHLNRKQLHHEEDDRYEGEELAVAAAVRVNKENIRLRALVETTAERMQAALESLKEKDALQQLTLSSHSEKATAVQNELLTTQRDLNASRAEAELLRQELERVKSALTNESQRAEAIQAEYRKQDREVGELRAQKTLLSQRVERLAIEAEAKVTEATSLAVSAQSQQSTRNEMAFLQTRCNELLDEVAALTADKDRLSLLLKKGRALSDQHYLGANGGVGATVSEDDDGTDASGGISNTVQWKDAPNWIPIGIVQASTAFMKRYPTVHERDMKDFLVACNSVWHSRLQAIADNVEKSATKRTKMLHTPYRQVLQASTISRLRGTISNLQALLNSQNPASVRFTSASVDLPRLTPGETMLLRGGGHGADVIQAKTNHAYSNTINNQMMRPRSANKSSSSHVSTEARLLSVPGSGGKRLDAEESRRLFDEAMQCIDYLARRLEAEEGRGTGFPNMAAGAKGAHVNNYGYEDDVISDAERQRLGDAGAEYARRVEGGGGGGGSHDKRTNPSSSSSSSSSSSAYMSSSLRQSLPDVATAAPRTLRFDEQPPQAHTASLSSMHRGGGGGGGGSVMDALTAAASPPRFSTNNSAYKRSIESW